MLIKRLLNISTILLMIICHANADSEQFNCTISVINNSTTYSFNFERYKARVTNDTDLLIPPCKAYDGHRPDIYKECKDYENLVHKPNNILYSPTHLTCEEYISNGPIAHITLFSPDKNNIQIIYKGSYNMINEIIKDKTITLYFDEASWTAE